MYQQGQIQMPRLVRRGRELSPFLGGNVLSGDKWIRDGAFISSLLFRPEVHFAAGEIDQVPRGSPSEAAASRVLIAMMNLRELVQRYVAIAGKFGVPIALSSFSLSSAETERLFSGYDEDYHISRFLHFTEVEGTRFSVDGIAATHVSIDAEIETIL